MSRRGLQVLVGVGILGLSSGCAALVLGTRFTETWHGVADSVGASLPVTIDSSPSGKVEVTADTVDVFLSCGFGTCTSHFTRVAHYRTTAGASVLVERRCIEGFHSLQSKRDTAMTFYIVSPCPEDPSGRSRQQTTGTRHGDRMTVTWDGRVFSYRK